MAETATAVARLQGAHDETVLIGGPPCQAYSLAGRARTRGNAAYVPRDDERHHLFRECIRVLGRLRPAAFVMENVKGMLSSTVESKHVFGMLLEDLSSLGTRRNHGYELRAIRVGDGKAGLREASRPSEFVVCAEGFGVPQRRHRVIVVGIRSDIASRAAGVGRDVPRSPRTVHATIGKLSRLHSGISRGGDDASQIRLHVRAPQAARSRPWGGGLAA